MTKFLADENIPPPIVEFLRKKGFDIKSLSQSGISGASDMDVMKLACHEQRVLLTFDKHFANVLLYPLDSHYGVIRIHVHPPLISDLTRALEHFLQKFDLATIRATLIVIGTGRFPGAPGLLTYPEKGMASTPNFLSRSICQ